jgi:hypothetical protein
VSSFQGAIGTENSSLGPDEVSLFQRMSSFSRVAIHRFQWICSQNVGLLTGIFQEPICRVKKARRKANQMSFFHWVTVHMSHCIYVQSNLSKRPPLFNGHLCYAATLFLSPCIRFSIITICPKRPSVLYGH